MRPYVIGALWVMVSAPLALLLAAVIRGVTRNDLAEEAEAYLRAVSGESASSWRRAVRLAVVGVAIAGAGAMSYGTVTEVPRRIVAASSLDHMLAGTASTEDAGLRPGGSDDRAAASSDGRDTSTAAAPPWSDGDVDDDGILDDEDDDIDSDGIPNASDDTPYGDDPVADE